MMRLCITTSGGVFLLLPLYALVSAVDSIKAACATVCQLCLLLHLYGCYSQCHLAASHESWFVSHYVSATDGPTISVKHGLAMMHMLCSRQRHMTGCTKPPLA